MQDSRSLHRLRAGLGQVDAGGMLRVARRLADLEASDTVRRLHIAEALRYRRLLLGADVLGR